MREISGLETLTGLEELWLGKNKITEIKGLGTLTNLKILSIQSNRLRTMTGLDALINLEELHISHNLISEISGLSHNTKLQVIDISANPIEHLAGLEGLVHLTEFWASNCKLASFQEVEKELRDKEELETVYFEGNPLQRMQPALYRNKVRLALPQVRQIDASKFGWSLGGLRDADIYSVCETGVRCRIGTDRSEGGSEGDEKNGDDVWHLRGASRIAYGISRRLCCDTTSTRRRNNILSRLCRKHALHHHAHWNAQIVTADRDPTRRKYSSLRENDKYICEQQGGQTKQDRVCCALLSSVNLSNISLSTHKRRFSNTTSFLLVKSCASKPSYWLICLISVIFTSQGVVCLVFRDPPFDRSQNTSHCSKATTLEKTPQHDCASSDF